MSSQDGNAGGGAQPTQKEAFFFLNIMNSMKNKPDVDWEAVAQKSGYSNGQCAQTRFRQIKKRLGYTDDGTGLSAATAKTRAPKKTTGSGTNKTPSKVAKKTPTKSKNRGVSKAEFAEAAHLHSIEEDKFSLRNLGNPHIKEDDDTSGSYSYDSEGHAENIEGYDEDGHDMDEDHFYDAPYDSEI